MGYQDSKLINFLKDDGLQVKVCDERISLDFVKQERFDFLISYGYRYIINEEILTHFCQNAINLHISLLPFNRGSDPNFWSFVKDTPKGVSIHYLDKGLDTGDIIVQKELTFDTAKESFSSTYKILRDEIEKLFMQNWQEIKTKKCKRVKQEGEFSVHKSVDKQHLIKYLHDGWDTNIKSFLDKIKDKI